MRIRGWMRWTMLLLALALALPASALADYAAYVSDNFVPVYSDASLSEQIGTLQRGAYLTVHAENNGVAAITHYGRNGYVAVSGLTTAGGEPVDAQIATRTRFYQQPSTGSAYNWLSAGTRVRLMSVRGTCAMIEYNERCLLYTSPSPRDA